MVKMIRLTPKVIRIVRTINLYASFFGLGLCMSITGPTLIDLEKNMKTDTQTISYIFTARGASYLGGSILGGIFLDRFNRHLLLIGSIFVCGVTTFLIPWFTTLWALIITVFFSGISMGTIDTGTGVLVLDLWKENPDSFIQALHFLYGVGSFVAPLIAEPFLSPSTNETDEDGDESTAKVFYSDGAISNVTALDNGYYSINSYAIVGAFTVLVGLSCTFMYFVDSSDVASNTDKERPTSDDNNSKKFSYIVLGLTGLLMCAYVGVESVYGQFLATFAVRCKLKLDKSTASFITSAFWGAYMALRGLSILISARVAPFKMLVGNILVMTLASIILVIWGDTHSEALWGGSALLGAGMASTYPSCYAWAEKFTGISNRVAAFFLVSGMIGGTSMSLAIGAFIRSQPMSLMYVTLGCSLACAVILCFKWRVAIIIKSRRFLT